MESIEQYRRDGFAPMPWYVHTNAIVSVTTITNNSVGKGDWREARPITPWEKGTGAKRAN